MPHVTWCVDVYSRLKRTFLPCDSPTGYMAPGKYHPEKEEETKPKVAVGARHLATRYAVLKPGADPTLAFGTG